jgi:exopolysaccharide biosynthesis protein
MHRLYQHRIITLVAFLLSGCSADAEPEAPLPLTAGALFLNCSVSDDGQVKVWAVVFSENEVEMHVIEQADRNTALSIADILTHENALAGCNGGYYKMRDFGVYGLQISRGVPKGEIGDVSEREGAFLVRNGKLGIERARNLSAINEISEMVQCSPLLVEQGRAVLPSAPDEPEMRRTFVATDGKGKWMIGTCNRISLSGLARLLARGDVIPELRIETAMNLDGGPSSGLWSNDAKGQVFEFKEASKVKNVIALFARKN